MVISLGRYGSEVGCRNPWKFPACELGATVFQDAGWSTEPPAGAF